MSPWTVLAADTLSILFCHFNLDGAGNGKMVRKFREIAKPAPYLSYLSGSFGENNRKDSLKKGGKFEISGFF